ncbi:Uma2 family endonuclease, partial [Caldicellulosiruptor sp. F32]
IAELREQHKHQTNELRHLQKLEKDLDFIKQALENGYWKVEYEALQSELKMMWDTALTIDNKTGEVVVTTPRQEKKVTIDFSEAGKQVQEQEELLTFAIHGGGKIATRQLFDKLHITVHVYHDRVEVRGLIPIGNINISSFQRVVGNLFGLLWQFFRDKPCNVYIAPFDVLFGEEEELDVKTVLQPDIFVVCDKSKLDSKRYCKGAPDFVIEVLSPSSVTADFVLKYNIYERYSVKEYWIVSPDEEKIIVFRKESEGKFGKAIIYEKGNIISTTLFEGLLIDVDEVFK